jgi:hypothetical protein
MPPGRFWRVEWKQGFGWPYRTRQERTARNHSSAEAAARTVAAIRAWPLHHDLERVFVGDVTWTEIDPSELPDPDPAGQQHDDEVRSWNGSPFPGADDDGGT